MGAQLFCALLRGLDFDARLVCSLQPLSFASAPPAPSPQKQKQTIRMTLSDSDSAHSGNESAASNTSSVIGNGVTPNIPPPIRRFGAGAPSNSMISADLGQAPSPGMWGLVMLGSLADYSTKSNARRLYSQNTQSIGLRFLTLPTRSGSQLIPSSLAPLTNLKNSNRL